MLTGSSSYRVANHCDLCEFDAWLNSGGLEYLMSNGKQGLKALKTQYLANQYIHVQEATEPTEENAEAPRPPQLAGEKAKDSTEGKAPEGGENLLNEPHTNPEGPARAPPVAGKPGGGKPAGGGNPVVEGNPVGGKPGGGNPGATFGTLGVVTGIGVIGAVTALGYKRSKSADDAKRAVKKDVWRNTKKDLRDTKKGVRKQAKRGSRKDLKRGSRKDMMKDPKDGCPRKLYRVTHSTMKPEQAKLQLSHEGPGRRGIRQENTSGNRDPRKDMKGNQIGITR